MASRSARILAIALPLTGCFGVVEESEWNDAWGDPRRGNGAVPAPGGALRGEVDYRNLGFEAVIADVSLDVCAVGEHVTGTLNITAVQLDGAPEDARGTLRFPLPAGAALHGADLWFNGAWVRAELVGRREAHDVYDQEANVEWVVEPERFEDPLVIHQVDAGVYRALLYPVLAGRPYRFRVHYAYLADREDDGLIVPLLAPGWNDGVGGVPRRIRYRICPEAEQAALPIGDGGLSEWSREEDDEGGLVVEAEADELDAGSVVWATLPPVRAEGTARSWRGADGQLYLHGAIVPRLPADLVDPPRRSLFLLDVSGSMAGAKLTEAAKAVGACLTTLEPGDRFALATFSSYAYLSGAGFVDVTPNALRRARATLDGLQAGGGTNFADAFQLAFPLLATEAGEGPTELVLVTDGRPNDLHVAGEPMADWVRARAHEAGARVHTIGIGRDLDAPLLRRMALETGGRAAFALDDAEIVGLVRAVFAATRPGGLRGATLTLFGEGVSDAATSLRGDLRRGQRIELGARLEGAEVVHLALEGQWGDGEPFDVTWRLPVPQPTVASRAAPGLYGRLVVEDLYRRIDAEGETPELLYAAAVTLRRFGLVGRYSGYLGLETEAMYTALGIRRVQRDEAGVAAGGLGDTRLPEARVGGDGALDGSQADPWAGAGGGLAMPQAAGAGGSPTSQPAEGCACSVGSASPVEPLALLLLAAALGLRRRRWIV